jgi:uncharacterized protein (DUF169 family)
MDLKRQDYSILKKFNFEREPVGIKYLLNKPAGINKLDGKLAFCQMFKEAQNGSSFYMDKENCACVESKILGFEDFDPIFEAGQIGAAERIFQEARANRRIYQYLPRLAKGSVRYVALSPVDKMSFEPDVLVITASPPQAEILFRALSYSTGRPLTSKWTPVLMCAWLFLYPFVSGEINYAVTGLGYGLKTKKLLPEGLLLISIPFDQLSMVMENLKEMDWVLPMYTFNEAERREYSGRIMEKIRQEYTNG